MIGVRGMIWSSGCLVRGRGMCQNRESGAYGTRPHALTFHIHTPITLTSNWYPGEYAPGYHMAIPLPRLSLNQGLRTGDNQGSNPTEG